MPLTFGKQAVALATMMLPVLLVLQGCAATLSPPEIGATGSSVAAANSAVADDGIGADDGAEKESGAMSALKSVLPKGENIVGTPTELYTRIARGALSCWFGASGPLKGGYIYHAEAAPPSKGGRSEISIRVRDKDAKDPRSLRAYRVVTALGESGGSTLEVENVTIPEPLATSMTADVKRWAADEEGCSAAPATQNWAADREQGKKAENPPDKSAKSKTAATKKTSTKKD